MEMRFGIFEKYETILKISKNVTLYKTTTSRLNGVVNWNKNRPADPARIEAIKEHLIKQNANTIPGIIYAWDNGSILEIFDGFHRYSAGQFKDLVVLIQIYKNTTEDIIIEEFKNINKSISVPVLYFEENNYNKRKVCESVAKNLCQRYPNFVSSSRNHQRQNFHHDFVVDMISKLEIDFNKTNTVSCINQELFGLNLQAKDYVSRHRIKYPKKCDQGNFYLFYLEQNFIISEIEKSINMRFS